MGEPIDREHLAGYSGGDATLEAELVAFFADHAVLYIAELAAAGDALAWRTAAHKLKGASRSIGALELGSEAEKAERACEDLLAAGSEVEKQQQLDALTVQLERVRSVFAD
jgi:HPt (histidine-containing phosphotransfer) domain-containing protein